MALKTIDVTRTTTPRPRPDEAQLGFGKYFADHMLLVEYGRGRAVALHYARVR